MELRARSIARDPTEVGRSATPLELFSDLAFVVAVAQAGSSLHHGLVAGDAWHAIGAFAIVFFGIWWAWVNFVWFASAYDTDDVPYRLAVLTQVTGVLVLGAGAPRAFDDQDFTLTVTGYVIMRLALVALWLRVARRHPERRRSALRFAVGVGLLQICWVARLAVSERFFLVGVLGLGILELAVPLWAEAAGRTPWHPGHITERYGLFTIIVLGESIFAATLGVQVAADADSAWSDLAPVVLGGLLVVFAMWWLYFDMPTEAALRGAWETYADRQARAVVWSYGHYFVFAGAAVTGAGLLVAIDQATGRTELTDLEAGLAVTAPVSVYLVAVWALHFRYKRRGTLHTYTVPVATVVLLAAAATPSPALVTGVVLASVVALSVAANARRTRALGGEGT